jgi:hypothetical protein
MGLLSTDPGRQGGWVTVRAEAALLLVFLCAGGARTGDAAIPPCFDVVTPQPGATGVPTNVRIVLRVGQTDTRPYPHLFSLGGEEEKEIDLDLEAQEHASWATPAPPGWTGPLNTSGRYTFKPREVLRPRTRYEIRCPGLCSCRQGGCSIVFTTGAGPARRPSPKPGPAK